MDNPFNSPFLLLKEANEYISRVEHGSKAFINQKGNTGGTEVEAESGEILLYVQFATDIPSRISMDVRGAARELREALDHAVYASSILIYGGKPEKTKFLVADTANGIQDEIKRKKCKDVHEDIITLMVKENACEAGNETIWTLNKFRNSNTHKVVSISNLIANGMSFGNGFIDAKFAITSDWRSTRKRFYFARCAAISKFTIEIAPTLQVCLQRGFRKSNEPASTFLRRASQEVERIIGEIEKETNRIVANRP